MTHIRVGKLTNIGSDNGLSPGRHQAIIWTNVGKLLIGPLGTNFSEIWTGIETFSFRKKHLKMSSAKWRPFCLGLNVLQCFTQLQQNFSDYLMMNLSSKLVFIIRVHVVITLGIWYIFVYRMCNGSYPRKDCGLDIVWKEDYLITFTHPRAVS